MPQQGVPVERLAHPTNKARIVLHALVIGVRVQMIPIQFRLGDDQRAFSLIKRAYRRLALDLGTKGRSAEKEAGRPSEFLQGARRREVRP